MRTFFAAEIEDPLRGALADVSTSLRSELRAARFVPVENIHLTIRFLGATEPRVLDPLVERLERELRDQQPFELEVAGLGAFPNEKRPRVLWACIPKVPEPARKLAALVERSVVEAGFEAETRPLKPHLTLARFKKPERHLARVLAPMKTQAFGRLVVSAVTCFESRLSPRGASYRPLARLPLGPRLTGRAVP